MDPNHPNEQINGAQPTKRQLQFTSPPAFVIWMLADKMKVSAEASGQYLMMLGQPEMAAIFFTEAQNWLKIRDDFYTKQTSQILAASPEDLAALSKKKA